MATLSHAVDHDFVLGGWWPVAGNWVAPCILKMAYSCPAPSTRTSQAGGTRTVTSEDGSWVGFAVSLCLWGIRCSRSMPSVMNSPFAAQQSDTACLVFCCWALALAKNACWLLQTLDRFGRSIRTGLHSRAIPGTASPASSLPRSWYSSRPRPPLAGMCSSVEFLPYCDGK